MEDLDFLEKAGLTRLVVDEETFLLTRAPAHEVAGGRWNYVALEGEHRVATNPQLLFLMQSSTNAQVFFQESLVHGCLLLLESSVMNTQTAP